MKKITGYILALFMATTVQASPVVEFYNTNLDHYFITADANEASQIDSGSAGPGWIRTGNTFNSGGTSAVCRFYGSQSPGPNSHFYTVSGVECLGLKQLQASTPATLKRWNFESLDFASTPPVNKTCGSGTVPVYRAYNSGYTRGIDSNHRITSNLSAIQEVVNKGWISEGVVMCAPVSTCTLPAVWDGNACTVPPPPASCSNGLDISAYPSCVCPSGQTQNGSSCAAPSPTICYASTVTSSSSCNYFAATATTSGQSITGNVNSPSGYTGSATLTCNNNGAWSVSNSTCVSPPPSCSNGLNISVYPSCVCPSGQTPIGSSCATPSPTGTVSSYFPTQGKTGVLKTINPVIVLNVANATSGDANAVVWKCNGTTINATTTAPVGNNPDGTTSMILTFAPKTVADSANIHGADYCTLNGDVSVVGAGGTAKVSVSLGFYIVPDVVTPPVAWWPPSITPAGVKVVGANTVVCSSWYSNGYGSPVSQCWKDAVTSGTVKFVATPATDQTGRPVVFAYFRNTSTAFGVTGLWNYLPIYADDGSLASNDISGGVASEVDWVSGSSNGITVHNAGSCVEMSYYAQGFTWSTRAITCPF